MGYWELETKVQLSNFFKKKTKNDERIHRKFLSSFLPHFKAPRINFFSEDMAPHVFVEEHAPRIIGAYHTDEIVKARVQRA